MPRAISVWSSSPLAAFSFHPLETAIESFVILAMPFLIPVHPVAIGLFLFISHCMNAMGHLGYEIFPSGFVRGSVSGLLNTSTHHNMHHQFFTSNYGLYFNFWDRLMGTNHPRYHETFEQFAVKNKAEKKETTKKSEPLTEPHLV